MPACTRIPASLRFSICALAACMAFWTQPAFAAFGAFSIPVGAAVLGGGATRHTSILLPVSGSPTFMINFMLPHDYQQNEEVRITIYLAVQLGAPCNARIVPSLLIRSRPGAQQVTSLSGLSGSSDPLVAFPPGANVIVSKTFTLNPGRAIAGQKIGDAFHVQIKRESAHATDTCNGGVFVHAINLRYTLAP